MFVVGDRDAMELGLELSILLLFPIGACRAGSISAGETVDVIGGLRRGAMGHGDGTTLGTLDSNVDGLSDSILDDTIDGVTVGIGLFGVGGIVEMGGMLELLSPIPLISIVAYAVL